MENIYARYNDKELNKIAYYFILKDYDQSTHQNNYDGRVISNDYNKGYHVQPPVNHCRKLATHEIIALKLLGIL